MPISLRINLDGSVPSDDPFVNVPNAIPSIYAYGLRNPFRFTFLPDGRAMTEDTGSDFWEEMDTIQKGGNYGWDFVEGDCGSCGYLNPAYAYGHLPVDGAASAMAAYSGNVFPAQYAHTVFFGDYNRLDIEAVNFDPTYTTEISDTVFDSSVGTIADLQEGPDGDLYYVSIFQGQFWKIYPTGPFAPTAAASATPNAGPTPLTAQFSSAGSSDPYNLPLTYSWDFGDGSPVSTDPNPSHLYSSGGTYTATLTVSNGTATGTATTNVVVGQSPPVASIDSPVLSTTYNAGSSISFSGSATDAVDGTLPASDFTWQVDFVANGVAKPSYFYEVPGPFYGPVSGVSSGSFQIPTDVSNVPSSFYRITMTVTDSLGLTTVVTRDIHPNTTSWTVNSNVSGAKFWVDGALETNSFTTTDVVGVQHVLIGVPDQVIGGTEYRLHGFADGSADQDTFTSSASPATYTVVEDPVTSTLPAGWTSVDVGAPLMPGATDYSSADQTFYEDGSGVDMYSTNDQFHYTYMTLTGDGTIIARIRYQTNTSPSAKAGIMFKETPTAGANYLAALVYPDVSLNTPNTNGVDCTPDGCAAPLPPVNPAVGKGVKVQYSPTGGITPTSPLANYLTPNKWLKLQRAGNLFTAYESIDGVNWSQIGHRSFVMASTATVGLFDTSHNTGQYSSVAFDNVSVTGAVVLPPDFSISANPATVPAVDGNSASTTINTSVLHGTPETVSFSATGLPAGVTAGFSPTSVTAGGSSSLTFNVASSVAPGSYPITVTGTATSATHSTVVNLNVTQLPTPWLDTDVGAPLPAGSASYAGGVFTVKGSGADIFGTNDQFNYVYQPTTGNGTIIARVTSQSNTGSSNSKAGVIWKASTTSGSPYILIESGPAGVVKAQYNFSGDISGGTYTMPNLWMKLVRSGNLFSAYLSPDGLTWTAVLTNKSLPTIPASATVGIYEVSHKPGVLGTATFDNVTFTPGP